MAATSFAEAVQIFGKDSVRLIERMAGSVDVVVGSPQSKGVSSTENDGIDAFKNKKKKRRTVFNSNLLPLEIKAIQDYIETLPNDTDTSNGFWHIVLHTEGKLKGKRFAYRFNTSFQQYEQNRIDEHDGFEILDKREISNLSEEQLNTLENVIKNRGNIDSVLSKQGTWNEERSLFSSDGIINDRQAERNNDRLDKQTLQGEPDGRRSNRDSRSNQGTSEIEKKRA